MHHHEDLLPLDEVISNGIEPVLSKLKQSINQRPVYLCWDMDVLDPAFAPGVAAPSVAAPSVAAPSWGGLTAREALHIVRCLTGSNIVYVDFNTVSAPHDSNSGAAASLCAQLMYEVMSTVATS